MTRNPARILLACAVLLGTCEPATGQVDQEKVRAALANATYRCPVIVLDGSGGAFDDGFTLQDGKYEAPPDPPGSLIRPSATLDKDHFGSGDLNGDGQLDAAALVWEYGGGTGTFAVLYVFDDVLGSRRCTHSIGLGDRIDLSRVDVLAPSTVLVEFKTHAAGQGMAELPAQGVARRFLLTPESASATDRQSDGSWQRHQPEYWRVVVEPSRRLAEQALPTATQAQRRLKVIVEPVIYDQSGFGRAFGEALIWSQENRLSTSLLRSVEAHATEDGSLHLRFDIARRQHERTGIPFAINACCPKLRVILYDDRGLELERFWTAEHFGTDADLVKTGRPATKLLAWTSNHLSYPVVRRDLDEAQSVVIGFGYPFGAMEREAVRRSVAPVVAAPSE